MSEPPTQERIETLARIAERQREIRERIRKALRAGDIEAVVRCAREMVGEDAEGNESNRASQGL